MTIVSDFLQMAIDHPKYLCKAPGGEAWLCKVVFCMVDENKITEEQAEQVTDTIHDSLSGCCFRPCWQNPAGKHLSHWYRSSGINPNG